MTPPAGPGAGVSPARSGAARGWDALTTRLALEWAHARRAFAAERFVGFVLTSALVGAAAVAVAVAAAGLALVFLAEWLARYCRHRRPRRGRASGGGAP